MHQDHFGHERKNMSKKIITARIRADGNAVRGVEGRQADSFPR
jgi:hypothetical protein